MKIRNGIEKISKKIIEVLSVILYLTLVISASLITVRHASAYDETFTFVTDSPFINIVFASVMMFIFYWIVVWVSKNMDKRRKILLIAELIIVFAFGLGFSAISKCFPTADQASVYYGSKHFAANYYGDLAEINSYFSVYPHQMALALAQEIVFRVFHTDSYHLLQGINALCNSLTVWSLFSISDIAFENKKVSVYTLLISVFCLPLLWYTPFVYGDLASIAFSLLGVTLILKALLTENSKLRTIIFLVGSLFSLLIATLVRTNTLIFVIALVLVTLVYLIKEKKPILLIYVLTLAFLCAGVNKTTIALYEYRSGQNINDGMPSICHMVMGLTEGEAGNGYYNGYNFDTYVNRAGYNQDLARELAQKDLNKRISEFKDDPVYAFEFFKDKFLAQWMSGDFDCFHFTSGKYYDRYPIVESLFSGSLFKISSFYMDKYMFLIYISTLTSAIALLFGKRKCSILGYTTLVAIIGGWFFYTIWEASGRYILPYFIYAIPLSAVGIDMITEFISKMMEKGCKNKA